MHWKVFKTGIMKIKVYQYFAWFCLGLCTACYSGVPEDEGEVGQGNSLELRLPISRSGILSGFMR